MEGRDKEIWKRRMEMVEKEERQDKEDSTIQCSEHGETIDRLEWNTFGSFFTFHFLFCQ